MWLDGASPNSLLPFWLYPHSETPTAQFAASLLSQARTKALASKTVRVWFKIWRFVKLTLRLIY